MNQMVAFVWTTSLANIQHHCMTTKKAIWKVWKNTLLSIKSSAEEKEEKLCLKMLTRSLV